MAESKRKSGGDHQSEGFGFDGGDIASKETNGGGGGRGRGQGDSSAKPWQQDGDWMCPNTSCTNVNFAFRGVCNRCGTARPAGASGGGMGGGGRGRGRGGGADGGPPGKGASTGLFGPNDWSCPMCGNVNWAKRLKCNVCNTNKPGQNEGGVRGGRGGGYKELDEQELEETKRRRREAEEDDGEMYDEFGNLKKKYRVKTNQADTRPVVAAGRAGWQVEELGVDRDGRERSRDRQRDRGDKHRDHHNYDKDRRRSRSRERERGGKERDYDYDHDRNRDRDRDYSRGSRYRN
ncbi:transcription initiation factor TFIID subunit 15-like isoform X2 [Brassica napus]|nr:transcription initiation factor TFIID subunit 15-like isoform X2 [Brassica napus]